MFYFVVNHWQDGVPRTAYKGVVTFRWKGKQRVFLTSAMEPWWHCLGNEPHASGELNQKTFFQDTSLNQIEMFRKSEHIEELCLLACSWTNLTILLQGWDRKVHSNQSEGSVLFHSVGLNVAKCNKSVVLPTTKVGESSVSFYVYYMISFLMVGESFTLFSAF